MFSRSRSAIAETVVLAFALIIACAGHTFAQDELDELSDEAADPIKLFNLGQNAHAKNEYEKALELYDRALELKPEFPEAEYQRAAVLLQLKRTADAEKSYRRAGALLPRWPLPHAALGLLLATVKGREADASFALQKAIDLDQRDELGSRKVAVVAALADITARGGKPKEALALWQRVTSLDARNATHWVARGSLERVTKDNVAALKSFSTALEIDARHREGRLRRAEVYVETGQNEQALEDLLVAESTIESDRALKPLLASLYERVGKPADARRILGSSASSTVTGEVASTTNVPEGSLNSLRAKVDIGCEDNAESIAKLEKIAATEPRNAGVLACLGSLKRASDPERSLDYFKRALDLEPGNADYATGYGAALLQLKRLPEAASVLEQVVKAFPDHYAAHANFATTLYALKLYKRAIEEYKWIVRARPELSVVHFLMGSAHDHLGEFGLALEAYQTFLSIADATTNQLEIEKVQLRLPSLRRQIARGEGVKASRNNR